MTQRSIYEYSVQFLGFTTRKMQVSGHASDDPTIEWRGGKEG